MSDEVAPPVVLDATVLSNFASSSSVALLVTVLDHPVVVSAVREELEEGYDRGHEFLQDALDSLGDGVDLVALGERADATDDELRARLDRGEAESLLVAIERGGTIATDDLAARRLAATYDVPVTGSIGVLALGVRRGVIDVETANEWLAIWREERGFYAPVARVEELLE